jgi:hypothetical protein
MKTEMGANHFAFSVHYRARNRKRVLQDLTAPDLYLLPSIAVGDLDFEVLQINLCFFGKSTRNR